MTDDRRVWFDPLTKKIVIDDDVVEADAGVGAPPLHSVDDGGIGARAEDSLVDEEAQVQVADRGGGSDGARREEHEEEEEDDHDNIETHLLY